MRGAVQARVRQNACDLRRIARIWLPVSDGSEVRPALSKLRRATKAACTDFGATHVRVLFHIDYVETSTPVARVPSASRRTCLSYCAASRRTDPSFLIHCAHPAAPNIALTCAKTSARQ